MRRSFFFVALAVATAFFGCAQILGIDDVGLRDAGSTDDAAISSDTGNSEGSAIGDAGFGPCVPCTTDNDGSPCGLACNLPDPNGIALATGGLVYWTTRGEVASAELVMDGGGVWRAPLNLSAAPTLIENAYGASPNDISISNAQAIVYSLGEASQIRLTDGGIDASVALMTGPTVDPTTVRITLDGTLVFFVSGQSANNSLYRYAFDDAGTSLFESGSVTSADISGSMAGWTDPSGDVTLSAFTVTAVPDALTNGQSDPENLALTGDGALAAWSVAVSPGKRAIVTCDIAKHAVSPAVWTGTSVGAMRFAPGAHVLYVTDRDAGNVFRIDLEFSPQTTLLASGQNHPSAIDLGATWIVWTNEGNGNSTGSVVRRTSR